MDNIFVRDINFKTFLDIKGYKYKSIMIEKGYRNSKNIIVFIYSMREEEYFELLKEYDQSVLREYRDKLDANRTFIHQYLQKYKEE